MKIFYITALAVTVASMSLPAFASQYDGSWSFKIQTTRGNCAATSSSVEIKNGKINGSLKSDGETFRINGRVKDDGSVKGKIGVGVATFSGQFGSRSGNGEWKGRFGCGGKFFIQ